jgi:hypothetical protein
MLNAGTLRTKASILRRSEPPFDVDNPPTEWVSVVDDYYVSVSPESVVGMAIRGKVKSDTRAGTDATINQYNVIGRYVPGIKPGMKLRTSRGTYDITTVHDIDDSQDSITLICKKA